MSELMNVQGGRQDFHWRLLSTASALALIASAQMADGARAEESARPTVWIELGPQLEQSNSGDTFAPPFIANNDWGSMNLSSPAEIQKMKVFSWGGEASAKFQPTNSDWSFSASVRYGRSTSGRHVHDQPKARSLKFVNAGSYNYPHCCTTHYFTPTVTNYHDTKATKNEAHAIIDFQVGKDVGLGLFGRNNSSVISAGVRWAQFHSKSKVTVHARANENFYNALYLGYSAYFPPPNYSPTGRWHSYYLAGQSDRSFHGIGPSISWKNSTPVLGNEERGEIAIDWGVNAAVLFGRQRAKLQHHTSGTYHIKYHNLLGYPYGYVPHYQQGASPARSRSVIVPNVGGFAGLSFKYPNAKVSFGYRADFFFGAMDNGIDTRKTADVGFHGPFATVSIGLGG